MKLKKGTSLNFQGVNYNFDVPENVCMVLEKQGFDFDKHFEQPKQVKKDDGKPKKTSK